MDMRIKFLRDILQNHSMEGPVDGSSSRFSILPFRRSEKRRHRVPAEIESRGGILWPVDIYYSDSRIEDNVVFSLILSGKVKIQKAKNLLRKAFFFLFFYPLKSITRVTSAYYTYQT